MAKDKPADKPAEKETQPLFAIQRLYMKDSSFETPHVPDIFRTEWKPHVNIELQTGSTRLEDGVFEVYVSITATAKVEEKVAFLAEVKQAGIFTVNHFPNEQIEPMLGIVCPNILFPYAREAISNAIVRGSFPQLNIDPVNFEAIYAEQVKRKKDDAVKH